MHNAYLLSLICQRKIIYKKKLSVSWVDIHRLMITYLQVALHQCWGGLFQTTVVTTYLLAHGMCMHWWPLSFTKDCGKHFGTQGGNCQHCRLYNGPFRVQTSHHELPHGGRYLTTVQCIKFWMGKNFIHVPSQWHDSAWTLKHCSST